MILVLAALLLIAVLPAVLKSFPSRKSRPGLESFAEAVREDQEYLLDLGRIQTAGQFAKSCPEQPLKELDLLRVSGAQCELIRRGASSSVRLASGKKMLLNQAGAVDFELLPGIGYKKSAELLKLRGGLGGFENFEQLKQLPWIKEKMMERIQNYFTIRDQG